MLNMSENRPFYGFLARPPPESLLATILLFFSGD